MHRTDKKSLSLNDLQPLHPNNPEMVIKLAISHRERGDSRLCRKLLSNILAHTPNHRGALLAMITTHAQQQEYKQALQYADVAIKMLPNDVGLTLRRAVLLRQLHRTNESILALKDLHSLHPDNPQVTIELAISYRSRGDRAACRTLLKNVLAHTPNHRGALLAMIATCAQLQDFKQALEYADEAIKIFPSDVDLALKRATLLRQLQRVDESILELENLHAQQVDNPQVAIELAISHRERGDNHLCQKLLQDVLTHTPNHRGALLATIATCIQLRDRIQALEYADKAIKALPNDLGLTLKRAVLLRQLQRVDESILALQDLHALHPDNSQVTFQLAISHRERGDSHLCQTLLNNVLTHTPNHRGALFAMIETCVQLQDHRRALEYADKANKVLPNDADLALKQAALLRQLQREDESMLALKKLHALHPDNSKIAVELATFHRERGDSVLCKRLLNKVLTHTPNHRGALLAMIATCVQLHDFKQALRYTDKALTAHPDDFGLTAKRATLLCKLNRVNESIEIIENLLKIHPDQLNLKKQLALFYRLNCEHLKSDNLILDFLSTPTSDKSVLLSKITAHLERCEFNLAVAICEKLIQQFPKDLEVQLLYADTLSQSHRYTEAVTIFNFLENYISDSTSFIIAKTMFLLDYKNPEYALKFLKACTNKNNHNNYIQIKLLELYIYYNKIDDAVKLITNSPKNSLILKHELNILLVLILLLNKQNSDAKNVLQRIQVRENPSSPRLLPWILKALENNEEATKIATQNIESATESIATSPDAHPGLDEPVMNTAKIQTPRYCDKNQQSSRALNIHTYLLKSLQGTVSPQYPVDRRALGIAWSFADQSKYSFADWTSKIIRSTSIINLFVDAVENTPEALDFLSDFILSPEVSILHNHYAHNKPFLIATSHFCIPWTLWWLANNFKRMRYIATINRFNSNNSITKNAITANFDNISIRKILNFLQHGGILAATIDANPALRLDFSTYKIGIGHICGRKVAITTLLPRLAWRKNMPIYWLQAKRANNHIAFDFELLASPLPEETKDAWCARWTATIAVKLEELICGHPENISLSSPIWPYLAHKEFLS